LSEPLPTGQYPDEGYSALDVSTSVAIAYVRDHVGETSQRSYASFATEAAAQAQRTLMAVDAACDMPTSWLQQHRIVVLPMVIKCGDQRLTDSRDDAKDLKFIQHELVDSTQKRSSRPLSALEIRDHLQLSMEPVVDNMLLLTFAAEGSKVYKNTLRAAQSLALIHNKVRRAIPNSATLNAKVVDAKTTLTGMGVLLAYAVHLRNRGLAAPHIASSVEQFRHIVHTLMVPDDLRYLRANAKRKDALPGWKFFLTRLFDIKPLLYSGASQVRTIAQMRGHDRTVERALKLVTKHVELGLSVSTVCVSFAGDAAELQTLPGFDELSAECRRRRVELVTSVMSMTGSMKLGPRALCVSFACDRFFG
jgi:fatty acid-binding protein DegV